MSSYINLTLDTIAPSGLSVLLNSGASHTAVTAVKLNVTCGDADTTGYQMKIWGTAEAPTESDASWETFVSEKTITLPTGDGTKTVYIKIRDDVWNESVAVSDTIILRTVVPVVDLSNVTLSRLSEKEGKNITTFRAAIGGDINAVNELRLAIVENINATVNDETNKFLVFSAGETANGSKVKDYEQKIIDINDCSVIIGDYVYFTLTSADILALSPGDGVKIIKVFAKDSETGSWSV